MRTCSRSRRSPDTGSPIRFLYRCNRACMSHSRATTRPAIPTLGPPSGEDPTAGNRGRGVSTARHAVPTRVFPYVRAESPPGRYVSPL